MYGYRYTTVTLNQVFLAAVNMHVLALLSVCVTVLCTLCQYFEFRLCLYCGSGLYFDLILPAEVYLHKYLYIQQRIYISYT